MGGIEAQTQRHDSRTLGDAGLARQGPGQGREDHEAGVTEYRDAHNVAHHAEGHGHLLAPDPAQDPVGQHQCATGFFQKGAYDRAGQDDNPDITNGAAKALIDGLDHLLKGHLSA